jgi:hypothetical protein
MSEIQSIVDSIQCTIPEGELNALKQAPILCEGDLCGGVEFNPDQKGCCPFMMLCSKCYEGIDNDINGKSLKYIHSQCNIY